VGIEIRAVGEDEFTAYLTATEHAFGGRPSDEEVESERRVAELDRSLAAFDGSAIVGTSGAFSLRMTVPGGIEPMAGVTLVGVLPTHRRRGILTAIMRRQLDDVRDRGEALAGLWASEGAIYGRFGFGIGTPAARITIDRRRAAFARPHRAAGEVRLVERAEAIARMPDSYDALRRDVPGMLERPGPWWVHRFADPERWRDGASALFFALHEAGGAVDGYVVYNVKGNWDTGMAAHKVFVSELVASSAPAYADLWRFCFDMDLVGTVEAWPRPMDEPLLHMLAEPRALGQRWSDGLWLRLVDVPRALAARRYAAGDSVSFAVRDAFCPWNEGTVTLEAGADGASCRASTGTPDLGVDVTDLGMAFLGGTRFSSLARAGRVDEHTSGALARADAMFGWDPGPWCPSLF
jgi:predicted acetyltransferase